MKHIYSLVITCIICLLLIYNIASPLQAAQPRQYQEILPPEQPAEGPGGSQYTHAAVRTWSYRIGARQVWIFTPSDPEPSSAPVVVFYHGWSAFLPIIYRDWIKHLVYHGNIVIYPRYQRGLAIGYENFYENAMIATEFAFQKLQQTKYITPELDHVAVVGHSLGGGMTLYHAALWDSLGLPKPQAAMAVQPVIPPWETVPLDQVNSAINLLVVIGEDDDIAEPSYAKTIYYNTTQILADKKDYIIMQTDTYGDPDLIADHLAPLCSPFFSSTDALDYFGTWKLFDALLDYSFYGMNKEYCLGNTSEQRYMGLWSDDTSVRELIVTDNP